MVFVSEDPSHETQICNQRSNKCVSALAGLGNLRRKILVLVSSPSLQCTYKPFYLPHSQIKKSGVKITKSSTILYYFFVIFTLNDTYEITLMSVKISLLIKRNRSYELSIPITMNGVWLGPQNQPEVRLII